MEKTEHNFRFAGHAIPVAPVPGHDIIEPQAAVALPWVGGHHSADIKDFHHHKYVRFERAHSTVLGTRVEEPEGTYFSTMITSMVEGLNIMNKVTADRVVACIVSEHSGKPGDQPTVKLIGSHFDNLRVAGVKLSVDLAVDIFDEHDTHQKLSDAYASAKHPVRGLLNQLAMNPRPKNLHLKVARALPDLPKNANQMPSRLSLVRSITPEFPVLKIHGHIIHVEGFGVIRLAEVHLRPETRALTMLRCDLGSPVKGHLMIASSDGGGGPYG